ncbi:uncharacterized protein J3D65DRAFT_621655 [Phyllosticta citribraziliensis]|uniref:Transmembrane protein n=1 Tax=Phyllosticta citribraziliensis TaxID=989973 RepID=A0ABR1LT50_9PEZI
MRFWVCFSLGQAKHLALEEFLAAAVPSQLLHTRAGRQVYCFGVLKSSGLLFTFHPKSLTNNCLDMTQRCNFPVYPHLAPALLSSHKGPAVARRSVCPVFRIQSAKQHHDSVAFASFFLSLIFCFFRSRARRPFLPYSLNIRRSVATAGDGVVLVPETSKQRNRARPSRCTLFGSTTLVASGALARCRTIAGCTGWLLAAGGGESASASVFSFGTSDSAGRGGTAWDGMGWR